MIYAIACRQAPELCGGIGPEGKKMLIGARAQIAFVQIPKNGSKSIRQAMLDTVGLDNSAVAADLGWSVEQFETAYAQGCQNYLPAIGSNNLDHLTLSDYRLHLPHAFKALCDAHSFALVRKPRERFLSALLQRMGQFKRLKALPVDDPRVREEAELVCNWLDGRGNFHDKEFIHFARQIDYVDLDGERMIDAIFPIDRTDAAEAWIEEKTGIKMGIAHEHARKEPKGLGHVLHKPASVIGRNLLPSGLRKAIYPLYKNSPLFDDAAKRYKTTELGSKVEDFIANFYADDFLLYQEAAARPGLATPEQAA